MGNCEWGVVNLNLPYSNFPLISLNHQNNSLSFSVKLLFLSETLCNNLHYSVIPLRSTKNAQRFTKANLD